MTRIVQPGQLILTIYGLYARAEGGWLSVASLITLLGDLGVDEPAVRSSISRLKRRGILRPERRESAAGYELSEDALAILREGDLRIFRRERATLDEGWVLAVFSVPESERNKRHVLRSQLTRLGFGTAAPGVWIAPAHLYEPTADILRRLDLTTNADLFRADHLAFGDLAEKVPKWWDLEQLQEFYSEFLDTHRPVLERWAEEPPSPKDAFVDYVQVLTDWRQLPYLDPGIPAKLLPGDWIGIQAADLFFTLQARLDDPARDHVTATIG
jgi:phenylacetic acid degradation operon negative regulatory protein